MNGLGSRSCVARLKRHGTDFLGFGSGADAEVCFGSATADLAADAGDGVAKKRSL
jgi:hypothetical protein